MSLMTLFNSQRNIMQFGMDGDALVGIRESIQQVVSAVV